MGRGTPGRDQERRGTEFDRLRRQIAGAIEVDQRHVERGQQPAITGAELDHRPVVGAGSPDRQLHIAGVLPVPQPTVVERVEDQLARETEQVECPAPVLGDEPAGGSEVLAGHDLGRLGLEVLGGPVAGDEPIERLVDVAQLCIRIAGLLQLVAAGVRQRRDPISDRWIGVIAKPVRSLHHVRVGVVHHEAGGVVRHHISVASRTAGSGCVVRTTAVRPIATAPSTTTMVTTAAIDRCSPSSGQPHTIDSAGWAS